MSTSGVSTRRITAPSPNTSRTVSPRIISLQLTLNKRFSHGYSILANYTWAKSIDNVSLDTAGAVQNSFDLRSEKALSDFDARKRFVTSFLWEIPSPKKGRARWLVRRLAAQRHFHDQLRLGVQRGKRTGPRADWRRIAAAQPGWRSLPRSKPFAQRSDREVFQSGRVFVCRRLARSAIADAIR